jgi:uncharacterized membrane protein YgcG
VRRVAEARRLPRALALTILAVGFVSLGPPSTAAQERIRNYDSEIQIRSDGSIDVTERITVVAEGSEIRRGIYRDIPTRYRDRFGNRVRVDLEVLGVERNGAPEAWFTERLSNGIRINTGGDDYLPTLPAEYTFTIRYRTTRQLGFFAGHDELYWNAIGTGWIFPIERGSVTVRLPEAVPAERLGAEGYTGAQGERGAAYTARIPAPGVAEYRLTEPLEPFQGFTTVLTFPKGIIAEPTGAERRRWFLRDNAGVLVALMGLLALLIYASISWWRVGRDPRPGVVIPRYAPPENQTPGSLRFLRRMNYDMRCFSADLLTLAVAGHVRIHRDRKRFSEKWQLERTGGTREETTRPLSLDEPSGHRTTRAERIGAIAAGEDATITEVRGATLLREGSFQKPLFEKLFGGGETILNLDNTNAERVSAAREAHRKALDKALHPRYFRRNAGKSGAGLVILLLTGAMAFLAGGGSGIPAIMAILVLMLVILGVFGSLVRAPTDEGRRLLDEVEGLKLYLSVAERQDIARMPSPDAAPLVDAERYEALLPYAVALEVEDAWTRKFTAAVGVAAVAAATQRMGWYSGTGRASDIGAFSRAIGSNLSSTISAASSPPGSSSGSGGGGSSGGGGGGGGGGGR